MGKLRDVAGSDFGKLGDITAGGVGWSLLGGGSGFMDMFDDISGKNQEDASKDAANLQYVSTMAGIEDNRLARGEQRADLAPFRGVADNNVINMYREAGSGQPSYAYDPNQDALLNNALNRTTRAVMESQAAKGKLASGGTQTSLMEAIAPIYMQRQGQDFEQKYNAQNQRFNQLGQLVSTGHNAAAGQGAATANATDNINELRSQGANALAAGQVGAANAQAQGTNNMIGLMAAAAPYIASAFSDERMKEDIERIGEMDDGTPIYTYKYKGDNKTQMGVMAHEARKKHPEAVAKDPLTNMLMVNYGKLKHAN